jgi:4-amino-4-deoxychorismate lyase
VGLASSLELATPDILRSADAAWLVSSVRLAAPIRSLDGVPFPVDTALSAEFNRYLLELRD